MLSAFIKRKLEPRQENVPEVDTPEGLSNPSRTFDLNKNKETMHVYKQRNGYDYRKYRTIKNKEEHPEYFEKVTEPGQAISVRKLVERYEKGQRARAIISDI